MRRKSHVAFSRRRAELDLNYFRELSRRDPNLALAALRIEVETVI